MRNVSHNRNVSRERILPIRINSNINLKIIKFLSAKIIVLYLSSFRAGATMLFKSVIKLSRGVANGPGLVGV